MDRLEQWHRREPLVWNRLFRDSPDACNVFPVLRVLDISRAGQLVALLPLLAASLAISLPGDHGVATTLAPDAAGGHDQVERGQAVLDSLGVVLDAACVQE